MRLPWLRDLVLFLVVLNSHLVVAQANCNVVPAGTWAHFVTRWEGPSVAIQEHNDISTHYSARDKVHT